MESLKIIFARSNWKPVSLLIQAKTFCKWSHCGVVVGNFVIESKMGTGVVVTSLQDFKNRYSSTLELFIPCISREKGFDFLSSCIDLGYDLRGVFFAIFNMTNNNRRKYHCAELVATACGLFNPERASSVSPADLINLGRITPEMIWGNSK